jgi:hypothetical protein
VRRTSGSTGSPIDTAPGELEGEILEETDDKIIFNLPSRAVIEGGINILPKIEVERIVP